MISINRILCPTGLSTESDEALRYAVALARTYGATLRLLHCRSNVDDIGGAIVRVATAEKIDLIVMRSQLR